MRIIKRLSLLSTINSRTIYAKPHDAYIERKLDYMYGEKYMSAEQ